MNSYKMTKLMIINYKKLSCPYQKSLKNTLERELVEDKLGNYQIYQRFSSAKWPGFERRLTV